MPALLTKPKFTPDRKHYPSIVNQGFNARIFNFGKAESPGVNYFNPGLVQRPDGLWLIARKSEAVKQLRIGMNSLVAFKLNERKEPQYGHKIKCKALFDREHFEDPRAVYHNGKTYISCCNFIVFPNAHQEKWTGAHICLQVINQHPDNWDSALRVDPVYGNNTGSLSAVNGLEKNWLWFFHKNQLYLLYQTNPHTVVRWSDDFQIQEQWKEDNEISHWAYGEIRGGTPPVFHDGLLWTFFHSSLPLDTKYRRRYYMGAYAFEPFPPFKIVKFTKEPLLAGSDEDLWAEKKPLVVFPCGAIMEKDKWFVTLGVNDLLSAWVEIPHRELLAKMGEHQFSLTRWASSNLVASTDGVIAYLPPPNIGHSQIFLKNLQEHPPSCEVSLLSDYPWPNSVRIPDPTLTYTDKDKIACYVFLQALELAEKLGMEAFIYLETDCRVSGEDWGKELLKDFYANPDAIASGNMAIFGAENGGFTFKLKLAQLTREYGQCMARESTDKSCILMQGLPTDKTVVFVNGAPAVYSVKALRAILGHGPIESIVARMKSSDLSIGEIYGDITSPGHALKRYVHTPKIMATAGETIYPFHVRKKALESGKCVAVHPIKNRWRPQSNGIPSFYHCGDLGDIIYSLKAIQLYGGGKLSLGPKCYSKFPPRSPVSKEVFAMFAPLLEQQEYLTSVEFAPTWAEWDFDMNDFRTLWNERAHGPGMRTLCEAHCVYLGVEPLYNSDPWLSADTNQISKIVIHRSHRYRSELFPWGEIVNRHCDDLIFVGLPEEHADFVSMFGNVRYFKPFSFSQMAAVINGADLFIGNQSFPCSIALGLGKRVWQETWLDSPDCVFDRPGTFYNGTKFPEDLA